MVIRLFAGTFTFEVVTFVLQNRHFAVYLQICAAINIHSFILYCIVLYCIVLYCIVLYCIQHDLFGTIFISFSGVLRVT